MRNIAEYIAEYEKTYDENNDKFYSSDFQQIMDISVKQLKSENPNSNLSWNLVSNALMAGYMIGYKQAKKNN